jgi:hypothetical protein
VIDSYSEATKQIWYFPTSVGPVKKWKKSQICSSHSTIVSPTDCLIMLTECSFVVKQ